MASGHTRRMFSKEVLDHFQNPRNAGELQNATVTIEVSNPVCGDVLKVAARVERDEIVAARFLCRGCTTAIACASRLTELLTGKKVSEAKNITANDLAAALGGLPAETMHGAHLAADAAQALAAKLNQRR